METSIEQLANEIVKKSKPTINGVMQGDLNPEEYLEKTENAPGLLGYTMSVLRTNPIVREWYYSEGDRYNNHVIIDSLVNGLDTILSSETSLKDHMIYPFFARAYKEYLDMSVNPDTPELAGTRGLLRYLYLYS